MSYQNGKGNYSSLAKKKEVLEEKEVSSTSSKIARAVDVAASGVAFATWGIYIIMGSEEENNTKMMKNPGADGYMQRHKFEQNPATYFVIFVARNEEIYISIVVLQITNIILFLFLPRCTAVLLWPVLIYVFLKCLWYY
ncbi:hypothetical protein MTR67_030885 [Solanum verrucosum]|uniref:Uncharacterized protein n=2 Tax=Solanum TaxID=4107 RepID=A0AAF0U1F7_SOLVR|nr:hypothetical protein MTR67_030885 [Solanum verrucosum]